MRGETSSGNTSSCLRYRTSNLVNSCAVKSSEHAANCVLFESPICCLEKQNVHIFYSMAAAGLKLHCNNFGSLKWPNNKNVWVCPADGWNKHSFPCEYEHFETANSFVSRQDNLACVNKNYKYKGNDLLFCVSLSPVHSVFAASPDLLYLWGPWQGEQGRLWSLHDLQQTGLQASLPCHLVSVKGCVFINV